MKYIAVLFLSLFLVSPAYADELAGLWETDSDTYVYFKEDGTFSFINSKTRTGYSWQRTGENTVLLHYSYLSSGAVQERECTLTLNGKTLTVEAEGQTFTFKKSSQTVTTFTGEIFYRERMLLPPRVEVRYALYKNDETVPFALYFIPTEGKTPLPFSFDCVLEAGDKVFMEASVYHDNILLFATEKPVDIEEKNILLHRVGQAVNEKELIVPAKFASAQGDVVFLEKNGLAIVKKNGTMQIAHWAYIDRKQNIEISQENDAPLVAAVQDENTLVFRHYEDKNMLSFSRREKELFEIGKFNVSGVLQDNNGDLSFTDCTSMCRFPAVHKGIITKHFPQETFVRPVTVDMDVVLRRKSDGEIEMYPTKVSKADKGICQSMFQHTSLENTYWRLTAIGEKAVEVFEGQREPHIIIRDNMATGSDGCNNFFMPVTIEESSIKFGQGGATLMLCPHGEEQAREFNQVLNKADAWQINGSILKLLENNSVSALFEAVYL